MNPADLIQSSSLIWLMGTGLVLGALHALEPGHAKTLIASFVVATRGSVPQAVVLGLSAAVSHSVLVWVLALGAIMLGDAYIGQDAEPWLQLASGVAILAIGVTMIVRLVRRSAAGAAQHGHDHGHDHDHGHGHDQGEFGPQGGWMIRDGRMLAELAVFEEDRPPGFRLFFYDAERRPIAPPDPAGIRLRTERPDGSAERFEFAARGACLASIGPVAAPYRFEAELSLPHGDHAHTHSLAFGDAPGPAPHPHDHGQDHGHGHDHGHVHDHGADAHARAHARQIERRFDGSRVTTGQVAMFGLSSGLMPCPAALTMLLVCLRLKRIGFGIGLVGAFSLGLAITLVLLGVVASIGVAHASRRLPGFDRWTARLPYVSGALIICVGIFMSVSGFLQIP